MTNPVKKIAFKTIGCRLNLFETDSLLTDFYKAGYEIVEFNDPADVYVINTCTVTNQSDQKSRNYINQALRRNGSVLVVTGCMAENKREDLLQRNDITYLVDNTRKSAVFSIVDAHFKGETLDPETLEKHHFNFTTTEKSFHTRSLIKIQDGCNNFCSFCIVPRVRGRAISRPVNDILENIRQSIDYGYKEFILTGVNIGRYESDGVKFEQLIETILDMPEDFRLRMSSMEPEGFGKDFVNLFEHPKLCPHLHLCLQSGSDNILMQMRRNYTVKDFKEIIERFKHKLPDFNFTTDIIVGFPGETDHDFQASCSAIQDIGFSHIHTFPYSVRNGTRAARMTEQIPAKVKSERAKIIREIADENKLKYRKSWIGNTQQVLIERIKNKGLGYGEYYVPVEVPSGNLKTNEIYPVKIEAISMQKEPVLVGSIIT